MNRRTLLKTTALLALSPTLAVAKFKDPYVAELERLLPYEKDYSLVSNHKTQETDGLDSIISEFPERFKRVLTRTQERKYAYSCIYDSIYDKKLNHTEEDIARVFICLKKRNIITDYYFSEFDFFDEVKEESTYLYLEFGSRTIAFPIEKKYLKGRV